MTIVAAAGGGNWTTGATWVGGVAPTAADDVVLDATSGNVTVTAGAVCRSLDCNGYTGTLTHGAGITLTIGDGTAGAGNRAYRLSTGMTHSVNATSVVAFASTSTTQQTITFNGKLGPSMTFSGLGSSYQLVDAYVTAGATVTLQRGILDTNGVSMTFLTLNISASTARTLTLGASAISLSGSFASTTVTNLTMTANTAVITLSGLAGVLQGASAAFNYNGLGFVKTGGGTFGVTGTFTCANFSVTGAAAKTDGVTFAGAITVTGTLTLNGNSAVNRLLVATNGVGTSVTLTTAAVSAQHVDFMDIAGAGAASWNLSAITGGSGDCGGNSGITFTTPVTRFRLTSGNWSASNWSTTSGGSSGASVPLPQDTVILDANSGAGTHTIDMPRLGKDITCTGFTRTLAFSLACSVFGSLTLGSGMTISGTQITTLAGRGSHTLTGAGKTLTQAITQNGPGGTYTVQDAWVTAGNLTITRGTFVDNAQTITVLTLVCTAATATLTATGTWNLTSTAAATVWSANSAATITASAATIVISTTSASTRTFAGGSKSYGTLTYTVAGSTGQLTVTGTNTFGTINFSDVTNARTLALPTTSGITIGTLFNVNGTSGKLMTVTGDVTKASGIVSCDFLSLQNSDATGGATFYAGANSTNVSGNTGWIFTAPPSGLTISPTGIASAATFGTPTIITGAVVVSPTGIATGESVGTPTVTLPVTILPVSILTGEAVGALTVIPGPAFISPAGIASLGAFGALEILFTTLAEIEQSVAILGVGQTIVVVGAEQAVTVEEAEQTEDIDEALRIFDP